MVISGWLKGRCTAGRSCCIDERRVIEDTPSVANDSPTSPAEPDAHGGEARTPTDQGPPIGIRRPHTEPKVPIGSVAVGGPATDGDGPKQSGAPARQAPEPQG